ncbi:MAG: Tat pathway signal protein [Brevundimonas sp.]|nr:MAG: Tat pathway signal protein [Brevundimonas sp.]
MDRRALLGLKSDVEKTRNDAPSGGGSTYTRLATITANIRRPDGRPGVMTVETGLDAPDAALRTRVTQAAPRLRAAYAGVVQQAANVLLPGAPPDLERLIVQLQTATNQTLGRPGARVLIGTVMIV